MHVSLDVGVSGVKIGSCWPIFSGWVHLNENDISLIDIQLQTPNFTSVCILGCMCAIGKIRSWWPTFYVKWFHQ